MIDEPFTDEERQQESQYEDALDRLAANEYRELDTSPRAITVTNNSGRHVYHSKNVKWIADVELVLERLLRSRK